MADILIHKEWTDVIFEGKNKNYGAYELRALYDKYASRALLIGVTLFTLAIATPLVLSQLDFGKQKEEDVDNVVVELLPPPPIDPNTPPPPPPPPVEVEKVVASVKFLPPKVEEDEKVQEEEIPKQEDMKDVQIANKTQEGEKSEVDVIEETPAAAPVEEKEEVFLVVEEMPEFPGGTAAMQKFIASNIKYPRQASQLGLEGRVVVSFVINKDGNVDNVEILKGIGGGCDEEAIRVIKSLPSWKPGKQNGRPVSVKFTVPIKFTLQ